MLQLPSLNVAAKTQLLPFIQRCGTLQLYSWPAFITVVIQAHASWKLSCMKILHRNVLHVAHGYCTKLQHQDYMEQRKPDNNNYIYYMKNHDSTHYCGACSRSPQLSSYQRLSQLNTYRGEINRTQTMLTNLNSWK